MKLYEETINILSILKLKGIEKGIDEEINNAESQKISYLTFINSLLRKEVEYRAERRYQKNLAGAHFKQIKTLEMFEFGKVKGIAKIDISQLLDFRWVDNKNNILFFGPPGVGKTHLSIALGVKAIEKGYTVCFERIVNLIQLLKVSQIQRTAGFRINKIKKSNILIIDEIGYTPIEKKEANLFFNLISELYENNSIIITSNKGFEEWAEMLGDTIMTTALLDRLLHHAKIFNLDGDSYRLPKEGGK